MQVSVKYTYNAVNKVNIECLYLVFFVESMNLQIEVHTWKRNIAYGKWYFVVFTVVICWSYLRYLKKETAQVSRDNYFPRKWV